MQDVKKRSTKVIALLIAIAILVTGVALAFALIPKDEEGMNRGKWIADLIDTYGYPDDYEVSEPSFADIDGTRYEEEIEIALAYGIIDRGSLFRPKDPVTREFAAVTALRAMGYLPGDNLVCDDFGLLEYPTYDAVAVALGLLSLENNRFHPKRELNETEKAQIYQVIERTEATLKDTAAPDHLQGIVYEDGVTVLTNTPEVIEDGALVLPKNDTTASLRRNDLIVLEDNKMYRVDSVKVEGDTVRIAHSEPELYEVIDYLDIAGEATPSYEGFIPAEGVNVTYPNEEAKRIDTSLYLKNSFLDGMFDVPDSQTASIPAIKLDGEVSLDNGGRTLKIKYDLNLSLSRVAYKFDIDFNAPWSGQPVANVKNAYVKLPQFRSDLTAKFFFLGGEIDPDDYASYLQGIDEDMSIPLGSIPLLGMNGVGIVIDISLKVTAEGCFEVVTSTGGIVGCQILDNQLRNITALQTETTAALTLEIKAGVEAQLGVEILDEDIFNFTVKFGAGANAYVKARSNGMLCSDATLYAYLELSCLEDSLIDTWLNCAVVFNIWDASSSPLKLKYHYENMTRVRDCTFEGQATIVGHVADADDRSHALEGAAVRIYRENGSFVTAVFTDGNGGYEVTLRTGSYRITIIADGYIGFETNLTLDDEETLYMETLLMVAGKENEKGQIGGTVSNSVTGGAVEGVTLTFRKGWNVTAGEVVLTKQTDGNGYYAVDLPLGNYTVCMEKDGFVKNHVNVAVTRNGNFSWHGLITPDGASETPTGELRIVLSWGESPSDLDSHLVGPSSNGNGRFHVYYASSVYQENGETQTFLDVDDTSSYGPETITVYQMSKQGTYSYYVHDYSDKHTVGGQYLAQSGAKVQVYVGERMVATYHVPSAARGNTWHVFDYDAASGRIRPVNSFFDEADEGDIGRLSS